MLDWKSLARYWNKKALAQPDGVVGMARYGDGLAICHALFSSESETWSIMDADYFDQYDEDAQVDFVRNWLEQRKLTSADCHYVLNSKEYELLLLEAPAVEDSELWDAAIWRIKELIQTPIDDTAVDVMRLPTDAYRGRVDMLYAVATSKAVIRQHIKFLKRCDLICRVIDIPEMTIRNLLSHTQDADVGSLAVIGLRRSNGEIVIISHDALYLTRNLEMGIKQLLTDSESQFSLENDLVIDRLALDVQRSLDYYESQVGKGIVKKLYLLPVTDERIDIVKDLSRLIPTLVEPFNLYESVQLGFDKTLTPKEQAYCIPAIGAAIRMEEVHAKH